MLEDDHCYCFACGEHGDVIDFTAKLFDLLPSEAARKLGSGFFRAGLRYGTAEQQPGSPKLAKGTADSADRALTVPFDLYGLCAAQREWKARYALKSPEKIRTPALQKPAASWMNTNTTLICSSGSGSQRTELVEMLTADGTITDLQNRILRARKRKSPMPEMTARVDPPAWLEGKHVNEVRFCECFLKEHPMKSVNGTFFTVRNGTLFLDGHFTEEKRVLPQPSAGCAYCTDAPQPSRWLRIFIGAFGTGGYLHTAGYGLLPDSLYQGAKRC